MSMENLTQKSIEALNSATMTAKEYGNQQITGLHLLKALISDENGLITSLLKSNGKDVSSILNDCLKGISRLPKVSGGSEYLSADLSDAIESAKKQAGEMKDEFISVEHLFFGLIDKPSSEVKEIFKTHQITKDWFLKA